jgi:flavin-binding protein dodecin
MSDHLEQAKRALRRAEEGYHEVDWALVDVTRAVAEATVALAEEMRRANQIAFLERPWIERRFVPTIVVGEQQTEIVAQIGAELFPDE